ncbi:hypothetical protein [Metabacillus sp. FJAT-52054]|uniref:Uncharacterized protein n=1 Tax=Metabacillus sediminis TaxID=3117746 RepID=A0ABZ2NIJ5_9BACI
MSIYMVSLAILIVTTLLFFLFIHTFQKKEDPIQRLWITLVSSVALGLIVSIIMMVMYFFVTESLGVLTSVFKLELNPLKEIGILALVLVGYSLFLENFFEAMGKHAIGENVGLHLFLAGVRFTVLYGAGIMLNIGSLENFITAAGLTLVVLAMEFLLPLLFRKKKAGGL